MTAQLGVNLRRAEIRRQTREAVIANHLLLMMKRPRNPGCMASSAFFLLNEAGSTKTRHYPCVRFVLRQDSETLHHVLYAGSILAVSPRERIGCP
jgi:hypothetical protein